MEYGVWSSTTQAGTSSGMYETDHGNIIVIAVTLRRCALDREPEHVPLEYQLCPTHSSLSSFNSRQFVIPSLLNRPSIEEPQTAHVQIEWHCHGTFALGFQYDMLNLSHEYRNLISSAASKSFSTHRSSSASAPAGVAAIARRSSAATWWTSCRRASSPRRRS